MTKNSIFEINGLKNFVIPIQSHFFFGDRKSQNKIWDNLKIFKIYNKRKILKMSKFFFENGQVSFFLELSLFLIFQRGQVPRLVNLILKEIFEAFPKLGSSRYIEKLTFLLYKLTNRNPFIHKVSKKFIFLLKILFESKGMKPILVEHKQKTERFDITNEEMEIHLEQIRMNLDNFNFSGAGIYMNKLSRESFFDFFPKNLKNCFLEQLIRIFLKSGDFKQITKLYFSRFENEKEMGLNFKTLKLELTVVFFYSIIISNFFDQKWFVILVSYRVLEILGESGAFFLFCSNCIFPQTWSLLKKILPKSSLDTQIFLENSSLNFFRCLRAISVSRSLNIFCFYYSSAQIKNISRAIETDNRDTEHWFYKNFGKGKKIIKIDCLKKKIKFQKNFQKL